MFETTQADKDCVQSIRELIAAGKTRMEVANQLGLTYSYTCSIIRAFNLEVKHASLGGSPGQQMFRREMVEQYKTDVAANGIMGALTRLSRKYGITRERVRQIIKKEGLLPARQLHRTVMESKQIAKQQARAEKEKVRAVERAKREAELLEKIEAIDRELDAGKKWADAFEAAMGYRSEHPQSAYQRMCSFVGRQTKCRSLVKTRHNNHEHLALAAKCQSLVEEKRVSRRRIAASLGLHPSDVSSWLNGYSLSAAQAVPFLELLQDKLLTGNYPQAEWALHETPRKKTKHGNV